MMKDTYIVSALVRGSRVTEKISAYTEKQARYFFNHKYGYKCVYDIYAYVYKKAVGDEQLALF